MSNKATITTLAAIGVLALAALIGWFLTQRDAPPLAPPTGAASSAPFDGATAASAAATAAPPLPSASAPPVQYPVDVAELPPAAEGFDFGQALATLIGGKDAGSFLQTADFARRFVATVDNLGRSHAPPSLWPINPSPGRFLIDDQGATSVIDASNSSRYVPLVRMIEAVDLPQATAFYVRVYPLLQQAYEDIGYPKGYFNDRFIQVIDMLLATPEPSGPLQLQLTEVKGPLISTRPWVRYEFVDPKFESLSSGQKILLRVGADNRSRLKARLLQLRQALTTSVAKPR